LASRGNSWLFPSNREIFPFCPRSADLAPKTAGRINGLPANSRSSLNGNSKRPNRELNPPNRELPEFPTIATKWQNRNSETSISTWRNHIKMKQSTPMTLSRNFVFREAELSQWINSEA
jgi:hypothetical protein